MQIDLYVIFFLRQFLRGVDFPGTFTLTDARRRSDRRLSAPPSPHLYGHHRQRPRGAAAAHHAARRRRQRRCSLSSRRRFRYAILPNFITLSDTLISFYKNQVYKNVRLKNLKNLRTC